MATPSDDPDNRDKLSRENDTGADDLRLSRLDKRLQTAQERHEAKIGKPGKQPGTVTGLGDAYKIGIELVAGMLVGIIIGFALDDVFDTKPLFLILFLIVGFATGVRNVIRNSSKAIAGLQDGSEQDKCPHDESSS